MSCINFTLNGIANDCLGAKGGLTAVCIAPYVDGAFQVNNETENMAKVTDGKTIEWKHFYVRPNSSNYTQALTKDNANGISYVTQTINLVFTRMNTVKKLEMNTLINAELLVACKDANGQWTVFGYDAPVTCTAGTGDSGTAVGDGNKYTVALSTDSEWYAAFAGSELAAQLDAVAKGE